MRIHELAKELGITSKDVLESLQSMGYEGRTASSTVPEEAVPRLRASGGKVKPGGNFEFSGMVTETLQLGNLALRAAQRLEWDRPNLKVLNSEAAQKMVAPERRRGWEL